jgi:hypothetical protein
MSHPHLKYPSASEMAQLKQKAVQDDVTILTGSTGTLPVCGKVYLTGTLGSAMTIPAPEFGAVLDIEQSASQTTSNTLTGATGVHIVTSGSTGATTNVATLNAASERLVLGYLSANHWIVLENVGTITIS